MATPKNNSLKIGFVLDDGLDSPDGVQQYILAVGGWLARQGHQVSYLVGQTTRTDIGHVHSMSRNIKVRFNGNQLSVPLPTNRSKLRKFIRAERFDVLHIQVPYSPFMGHRLIMAADTSKTAIVGTFHIAPNNRVVTIGNRMLGWWLHASLRRFDKMLSVSATAADFADKTFGVKSEISPNVIDYPRFHGAKLLPQYDDDKLTILFLGRLVPRKGCLQLLEAVYRLTQIEGLPDFRVLICGTGPLQNQLRKYISAHKLDDIVELVGFVTEDDKPGYYASADISVFPSSGGESFGIVLLEAMASGKSAVLAGDNPGYRSVLEQRPELLFDPKNPEMLANLLRKYIENSDLRRGTQQWGAAFTERFDINVVGEQLLDVYAQALHKRRNP